MKPETKKIYAKLYDWVIREFNGKRVTQAMVTFLAVMAEDKKPNAFEEIALRKIFCPHDLSGDGIPVLENQEYLECLRKVRKQAIVDTHLALETMDEVLTRYENAQGDGDYQFRDTLIYNDVGIEEWENVKLAFQTLKIKIKDKTFDK